MGTAERGVFHVQVSGRGFSATAADTYNLSQEEVETRFVEPWEQGRAIVAKGKTFDPATSEITVWDYPHLSETEVRDLRTSLRLFTDADNVTDQFIKNPPGSASLADAADTSPADRRYVAVVHGRDEDATGWLFAFLRALDLHPIEWGEAVKATGSAAPSNPNVVVRLFSLATAVVVLFTPDETVRLHSDLLPAEDSRDDGAPRLQSRPNVLLEAGMALAQHPERTVLVEVGLVEIPSDLAGLNLIRLGGGAKPLHELANRLEAAGCHVNRVGSEWLGTDRVDGFGAYARTSESPKSNGSAGP